MWRVRPILLLAGLIALVAVAPPIAAQQPDEKFASLAGQFLVATPSMEDPRFARTVILMARHNKDGAFGLIINRPAAERPLSQLLEALGEKGSPVSGTVRLFAGGPVQPELGFVMHSPDYMGPQTLEVDGHVSVTMSLDILRDIGAGKGPQKSLITFGYAGWAPGQLENEMTENGWLNCEADSELIFGTDIDKKYERAMRKLGIDLGKLSSDAGHA
jgi:putative transcriptional regulator